MNFAKGHISADFAQENANRKRQFFQLSLLCCPAMQHGGANRPSPPARLLGGCGCIFALKKLY